MKIKRLSEHIYGLKTVLNIQMWLVQSDQGLVLIDSGIPPMGRRILQCIEQLAAGPLAGILLTHGHPDHVGGLEAVLAKHRVPVYAHADEIPYLEGSAPYPPFKKAKVRVRPGIVQTLPADSKPDRPLSPLFGLTPYPAPGHSPGHVVYYHEEDQVLVAGDLFMTRFGKLKKPLPYPLTTDMRQAVESGGIVTRLQPQLLTVCHGKEIAQPHRQYEFYKAKYAAAARR